jgi:hypothetical protein
VQSVLEDLSPLSDKGADEAAEPGNIVQQAVRSVITR